MSETVLITPFDEYNQTLVDNVHPSAWNAPEPAEVYPLVVVGGGTAGLVAAAGTAGLGGRVALVERHLLGGDCLNVGCVPSKAVIRAARAWNETLRASEFGLRAEAVQRDFGAAMKRMRAVRARISPNDSARRFRDLGVDVFLGAARFVGPDAVEVGGQRLRFHRALIATGSRPAVPAVPGLEEAGFLTNESVFTLQQLPARLAVVGGGPLGCELAQAFARFGSQVTLLLRERHLLPRDEAEAAAVVQRALEADGVRVIDHSTLVAVERGARAKILRFSVGGDAHRLAVDEILLATGRAANVDELGLDAAGVAYTAAGVRVDDRLRTSNPAIFAAGDVCSDLKFTHAADAMARIVIRNALFGGSARVSDLVVPWCTYTSPEVARVGLSREQLTAAGVRFGTLTVPLEANDRAQVDRAEAGFLLVHHRQGRDEILGATLVAEHAGETIGEVVAAIRHGFGLADLAATIRPYPTQAEVLKRAGDAWNKRRLTPFRRKLLGIWFRRIERGAKKRLAPLAATAPGAAPPPGAAPAPRDEIR